MENIDNPMKETKRTYDGRTKKRKWEERRLECLEPTVEKREKMDETKIDRIKRRKFAVLLGYSGADYFGMQRNPQTLTVEEDFLKSLLAINYISTEAFTQVQQIQFQRAARTDKGVSACGQVVSIKLPEEVCVSKINDNLPETIRVFDIKRVTKGFNSKTHCDARTYSYTIPTICFCAAFDSTVAISEWQAFRIDVGLQSTITTVLQQYVGTKNYHNFTSKKKPEDPSAKRYIISFINEEPTVIDDIEFITLKVKGQSFMMHQIRKMVGLCIAICRGYVPLDILTSALSSAPPMPVNIPRAPGLGLVLDRVHYDRYNRRYGGDGLHTKLEWKDQGENQVQQIIDLFRHDRILPTILEGEINGRSMLIWVDTLAKHQYDRIENEDDADQDPEQPDSEDDVNQRGKPAT